MLSQIGPALMLTGWGQRFTLSAAKGTISSMVPFAALRVTMPSTSLDLRA
jgi:hypothetical protein